MVMISLAHKTKFFKKNFSQNDMFLNQDNLVGFNEQTQKKFIINKKKNIKIILFLINYLIVGQKYWARVQLQQIKKY